MDKKQTDIVSYLTIVGAVVALLCGTKEESKFHINQGLVVGIFGILASTLSNFRVPFIGWILALVCWVAYVAATIIGIIAASNGEEKKLPILGDITLIK